MKIQGVHIEIVEVETLGGSPAKCTLLVPFKKARITIAKDKFRHYNEETKMFVILHELGHSILNSGDEITVDRWAFKQYAKTRLSLMGAVFALSKVLDPENNPEHDKRVRLQFQRAKMRQHLRGKLSSKKFKQIKI